MEEQRQEMPQIPDPRFLLPKNHPLAVRRLLICQACPLSTLDSGLSWIMQAFTDSESRRTCTRCKCVVALKTRVVNAGPLSRCPQGFW